VKVFGQPIIDQRSHVCVSFPAMFSDGLGDFGIEVNGDIQFGIRTEELST
jgi:hypothetical protein